VFSGVKGLGQGTGRYMPGLFVVQVYAWLVVRPPQFVCVHRQALSGLPHICLNICWWSSIVFMPFACMSVHGSGLYAVEGAPCSSRLQQAEQAVDCIPPFSTRVWDEYPGIWRFPLYQQDHCWSPWLMSCAGTRLDIVNLTMVHGHPCARVVLFMQGYARDNSWSCTTATSQRIGLHMRPSL
jgi:hypothetical protein